MGDTIIPVSFYDDSLALVDHDGEPFVAMRPVVENMGLVWMGQYVKLTAKFEPTIEIISIVAEDGKNREMICLPLRKIPAWLYSINPNKTRPDLREKIIRYQEECDDVLWRYWTQGYAARAGFRPPTVSQQLSAHGVRLRLLDRLEMERHPEKREAIHQQLGHASRLLGLPTPARDAIGYAEEPQTVPALLETFWETVELIGLDKLNHARTPGLLALNLVHVAREATAARLPLPPLSDVRPLLRKSDMPRFMESKAVNSALTGHVIKCWVFENPQP